MRESNIQTRRIARKIYGKEIIQMVRYTVRPRILGKNGEKLEMIEGQETSEKRDDENDPGGRRK